MDFFARGARQAEIVSALQCTQTDATLDEEPEHDSPAAAASQESVDDVECAKINLKAALSKRLVALKAEREGAREVAKMLENERIKANEENARIQKDEDLQRAAGDERTRLEERAKSLAKELRDTNAKIDHSKKLYIGYECTLTENRRARA